MKRALIIGLLSIICLVMLTATGCSHLEHVSAKTFIEKAQRPGETMYSTLFIGTAGGQAYLQEWCRVPLLGQHTNVLWTDINDFPPEVKEKLQAGKNPWAAPTSTIQPTTRPSNQDSHL